MAPKFGTSGLRGLVTELTAELVADYTRAFLAACPHGGAVHVGRDLRPSSPEIAAVVKKYPDVMFIVDTVSSFSVVPIPMDELGIDVLGQQAKHSVAAGDFFEQQLPRRRQRLGPDLGVTGGLDDFQSGVGDVSCDKNSVLGVGGHRGNSRRRRLGRVWCRLHSPPA